MFKGAKGGQLVFSEFEQVTLPSFLDYLRAGWQLSLTAAIDYTGSNGIQTSPNSLHYMGPNN